jgi:hypothetical protein
MSIRTQAAQPELVGEQTVGSLVRNVWRAYRRNFFPVFATFSLTFIPIMALESLFILTFPRLASFAPFILFFGYFLAFGPLTITLCDICVGNVPTIQRSYEKYFRGGLWLRVIGAVFLLYGYIIGVIIILGLMLWLCSYFLNDKLELALVIIGGLAAYAAFVWFFIRTLFVQTIVIMENRSPNQAIRRSFYLTHKEFWRLLGLTFALTLIISIPVMIFSYVMGAAVGFVIARNDLGINVQAASATVGGIINLIYLPFIVLVGILLFYDERVRRESYDAKGLYEDLMR